MASITSSSSLTTSRSPSPTLISPRQDENIKVAFNKYTIRVIEGVRYCFDGDNVQVSLENLDLSGSIAFTEDRKHVGWLHVLIYVCQSVYNLFRGIKNTKLNTSLSHGLLLLQQENTGADKLLLAHSVIHPKGSGARIAVRDYLTEEDVTKLVVYQPKDESLREQIIQYGKQTAFDSQEEDQESGKKVERIGFSILDMIRSFSKKQGVVDSAKIRKRIAYHVADLLNGDLLLDKKGKPRSLFCTPYALSILQATILANAVDSSEVAGKSRDQIAKHVFKVISGKSSNENKLYQTFKQNPICQLDARFAMTAFANHFLTKQSH